MLPEREEEGCEPCGAPVLADWRGAAGEAVLPERFFDRFMGGYRMAPLPWACETRSTDLDPLDARENEHTRAVRRRLRARQRDATWPLPVNTTLNPSAVLV